MGEMICLSQGDLCSLSPSSSLLLINLLIYLVIYYSCVCIGIIKS